MEAKRWTEDMIVALLTRNNKAVEHAIVALYKRQTADEQVAQTTTHTNHVGFSGADASTGSYYAQWINSGRRLTGNHLVRARKMAQKYRRQLCEIAQEKENRKAETPKVCECGQKRTQWSEGLISQSEAVCALHGQVQNLAEAGTYEERANAACDTCPFVGPGTTYYSLGAPVLHMCDMCRQPKQRTA